MVYTSRFARVILALVFSSQRFVLATAERQCPLVRNNAINDDAALCDIPNYVWCGLVTNKNPSNTRASEAQNLAPDA